VFSSPSYCSYAAVRGEAQLRRWQRRRRVEEHVAGGGREQALGGGLHPALNALLAHALPRRRCPLEVLRGAPLCHHLVLI